MFISVFYHGLGLYGYHHLRSHYYKGAIYLKVVHNKKRCGACGSWESMRSALDVGTDT